MVFFAVWNRSEKLCDLLPKLLYVGLCGREHDGFHSDQNKELLFNLFVVLQYFAADAETRHQKQVQREVLGKDSSIAGQR